MNDRMRPTGQPDAAPSSLRQRLLDGLAVVVTRGTAPLLLIAILAAIAGAVLAVTGLKLDADTNSLIGEDRPFMQDYRDYMEEFGDRESLWVVVDAGEPRAVEAARSAVDQLVQRLTDIGTLPFVHARINGTEQWRLAAWSMPTEQMTGLLEARGAGEEGGRGRGGVRRLRGESRCVSGALLHRRRGAGHDGGGRGQVLRAAQEVFQGFSKEGGEEGW